MTMFAEADTVLFELPGPIARAVHVALGVGLDDFGVGDEPEDSTPGTSTTATSAATPTHAVPVVQQGEPVDGAPGAILASPGSPGLDGVTDELRRRVQLLGLIIEHVTNAPTPLWRNFVPQYLRRARVEHLHELSSDDLTKLERDAEVFASQHGARA